MNNPFPRAVAVLALILASARPAHAAIDAAELQVRLDQLGVQGSTLLAQLRGANTGLLAPLKLVAVQGASSDYANEVDALASRLALEPGAIEVSPQLLVSLAVLSNNQVALSRAASRLGSGAALANFTTPNANLVATYATLLRLSDDIGLMADRIGVMADRILIMADKIGEMADRILVTQRIQSANYALTVDAILRTQQNMLLLMQNLKPGR